MSPNAANSDQTLRLLVVDDNEGDYVFTRELLYDVEDTAYEIDWAADEHSALKAMEEQEHDVYLLDHQLGKLNGLDLLVEVKRRGFEQAIHHVDRCKRPVARPSCDECRSQRLSGQRRIDLRLARAVDSLRNRAKSTSY